MKFKNLPRRRPRADYDSALQALARVAEREPAVCAMYMIGTVANSGISDLDVLLCLTGSFRGSSAFEVRLPTAVKKLIGQGTILKVPKQGMSEVKIIDDFPLQHILGEQFTFREYSSDEFEICRVMDWLPERLFTLARIRAAEEIDVIWALQVLKSVTVSLRKASRLLRTRRYHPFVQAAAELRRGWWQNRRRNSELLGLMREGEAVMQQALDQWGAYVTDAQFFSWRTLPALAQFDIPKGPKFSFGESTKVTPKGIVLPWPFLAFYVTQKRVARGWLEASLRKSLSSVSGGDISCKEELEQVIRERMTYVYQAGAFLRRAGIRTGLLKYGWFLS